MKKTIYIFTFFTLLAAGCGKTTATPQRIPGPVACTQEAKQCPDGSYVGRSGPNCEFGVCPTVNPTPTSSPPISPPNLPAKSGGISGYVHTGPYCPVQKDPPDPNCADRPYIYIEMSITNTNGKELQIQTDSSGKFSLPVPVGTYVIKVIQNDNQINKLPRCEEKSIQVTKDKIVSVDISCDTGIR